MKLRIIKCLFYNLLLLSSQSIFAAEILVASASNFSEPLKRIAQLFEQQHATQKNTPKTKPKVTLVIASTGKLYAQIKHGAPYDLFFSADERRAKLLDDEKVAIANSRFTYAIGKLALWSPQANYIDQQGEILKSQDFRFLAMANPKLAPYGKAAKQLLIQLGVWNQLQGRIVRGENIGQTYQFVKTANAQLGLIAYSQLKHPDRSISGSLWLVPQNNYTPIKQQAVLLKDNPLARQFYLFVKSPEAEKIIRSFGYSLENDTTHKPLEKVPAHAH
ncbi:molybdate ABC transporter substrate-binding protein [sulfur-oxidizing endosymbiont of Gigantopelta aegis]|uniref:molybdate ABC transporter substrate-binding protein n=1 Tax=sulfur-oxidizing endosymbiont of Gigantopelta aegis TaxID=2794934 RepID=UPI0018DE055F|nr:molybdate ABC transporter substrate-binding protein [sulfur-oxidizing endosymbiont of Gigantopelta aegis]